MTPRKRVGAGTKAHLALAAVLLFSVNSLGCAAIARSMAKGMAQTSVERELTFPRGAGKDFADCFGNRGGLCKRSLSPNASASVTALDTSTPPGAAALTGGEELMASVGAGMARAVLNHPVQRKINDFYNYLQGVEPERGLVSSLRQPTPTLRFDMKELDDYLMGVEAATAADGWDALAAQPAAAGKLGDGRRRAFLEAYFEAYFRSGHFFQFNLNPNGLAQRVREQLKKGLPLLDDDQIDSLVEELLEKHFNLQRDSNGQYQSVPLFGALGTNGFVTRGGASYSFPSIEAQLNPTAERPVQVSEVNFINVGADLVRVLLHAILDAHNGLPAVSSATGVGLRHSDALVVNTPGTPGHLSPDDFGRVEEFANRIEATSGAMVGRVVRGVSWIALNNEALAALIETTVGVAARKFAEKAAWCWYSCGFAEKEPGGPVLATARPTRLRLIVTGPAALMEDQEPWKSR